MDLVTQTVLGAAVGEAILGKKAGNKAIVWGAVGGLIPDLDVLITPLFNEVDALFVHRGFTHSILFAFLLAPILGWLIHRLHHKSVNASRKDWSWLIFWAAFTHPLLDYFTTYGTGAFLPFSGYRVELGTIGIVDIFYTIPFIIALMVIPFFKRTSLFRRNMIISVLYLTTFYLAGTVVNKLHVNTIFKKAFVQQQFDVKSFKTSPLPLSNFLWMGIAEIDTGYHVALYSNFDAQIPQNFIYIPKNKHKLQSFENEKDIKKLIRFTKGFYHINEDENGLYLADLRFGKMGISENADFIFKFYIKNKDGNLLILQSKKAKKMEASAFTDFINRIKGI